jgi:hypothetical protein
MITKIRKRDGRLADYDITKIENAIAKAMVYMANPNAVLNIWTDEVVIGPETPSATMNVNTNIVSGTVNMYAGTFRNGYSD